MTRRTVAISGVIAFVIVDGILVALALRGAGSGTPQDGQTSVTITRTVWDSPAAVTPMAEEDGASAARS